MIILWIKNDDEPSYYVTIALSKYVQHPKSDNEEMLIKAMGVACNKAIAVHEKLKKYFSLSETEINIGTTQREGHSSDYLVDVPFIEILSKCQIITKGNEHFQ
jgi:DNA-binding protein